MSASPNGQRHDRTALILYGSETGNSQDLAEELGRVAERLHFMTRVCEMDQLIDLNELSKYTFILFTVSTTGQGEFPRNSRQFWKSLLRKKLPPDCLNHVSFTTFGLGDSSYPKFNFAARKLHKRLEQLGANEIYPRGEADEQHEDGIDGTFLSWSADFRKTLLSTYPLPDGLSPIADDILLPPKYSLQINEEYSESIEKPQSPSKIDLGVELEGNGEREGELDQLDSVRKAEDKPNATLNSDLSSHQVESSTEPLRERSADEEETMATMITEPGWQGPRPLQQLKGDCNDPPNSIDNDFPKSAHLEFDDSIVAKVVGNDRVTPTDHWQDVRKITLKMPLADPSLNPGDTITIWPRNFPKDVQTLIDLMGWNEVADKRLIFKLEGPRSFNDPFFMSKAPGLMPVKNSTLRDLLTHNLDFNAIPKRHFFSIIAHYTNDQMHKERLEEFHNPIYTDEFFDYTTRPRRSILEVLQDFPSVKLPWQNVTTIFPPIRGREFSIASGGILHKQLPGRHKMMTVELLVAIVKYRTVLRKIRNGLCSRYLGAIPVGHEITIQIKENTLFNHIPKNEPFHPLILIGAGTGVAPLRSLIWDRAERRIAAAPGVKYGPTMLVYGSRNRDKDFFFRDEWPRRELFVGKVLTAFSRDNEAASGRKVYVQDVIRREGKLIAEYLTNGAMVYVCGSSGNMPKAVREALVEVLMQWGVRFAAGSDGERVVEKLDRGTAEHHIAMLEKWKRYIQETW
ncbi:hypothetical protein CJF31_00010151 [Rutstroemia sp. NJR-2017a BVV2]|nr:hypothetical protein CJF31_00009912 [Rutstroemia sp. NJR-2017a BVV2]PQE19707.1 hypothetical protein CJF31_00010151 [Rutstroemia sp. NJR-2017a BVV2]